MVSRKVREEVITEMVKNLLLIFIYILCVTTAQLLLKISMMNMGMVKIDINFFVNSFSDVRIIAGTFLYCVSFIIWIITLNRVEITFAYPLLSLSVVLVAVISWLFFNETFNMIRLSGIALTIMGAWLVVKS